MTSENVKLSEKNMKSESGKVFDVIVVGAGASGLVAAREISKTGKSVLVLEARSRIGGRIWPLSESAYGFQAQAGAEFVHGPAPVTKSLLREAGLTYEPMNVEVWNLRNGEFSKDEEQIPEQELLHQKLKELKKDLPIADFLKQNFDGERFAILRNSITKMVENFDAADPKRVSTFALRDEWLGGEEWQQGSIKEGYQAVLDFLERECRNSSVEISLAKAVRSVALKSGKVTVQSADGDAYICEKVLITVPLPLINEIKFDPPIPEKMKAVSKIGFGGVIKLILRFKTVWWTRARGKDLSGMKFLLTNEKVPTWWTQYPLRIPVLVGWTAGPNADALKDSSDEVILETALESLSAIFDMPLGQIKEQVADSRIVNWPADPHARGAYSYATIGMTEAQEELLKPVDGKIFFAGEALYEGQETATVEGALASGLKAAQSILK